MLTESVSTSRCYSGPCALPTSDLMVVWSFLFVLFLLYRLGLNPNPSTRGLFPPCLCRWSSRSSASPPHCLFLFSALDPPYGPVVAESRHQVSPPTTTAALATPTSGPPSSPSPSPPPPISRILVVELGDGTWMAGDRSGMGRGG
jgi:hypothetical protein